MMSLINNIFTQYESKLYVYILKDTLKVYQTNSKIEEAELTFFIEKKFFSKANIRIILIHSGNNFSS